MGVTQNEIKQIRSELSVVFKRLEDVELRSHLDVASAQGVSAAIVSPRERNVPVPRLDLSRRQIMNAHFVGSERPAGYHRRHSNIVDRSTMYQDVVSKHHQRLEMSKTVFPFNRVVSAAAAVIFASSCL